MNNGVVLGYIAAEMSCVEGSRGDISCAYHKDGWNRKHANLSLISKITKRANNKNNTN